MSNEPFFRRDGTRYLPNPISRGPWSPDSLHGRVVIGLLGHGVEVAHGDPEFQPVRLTVDLFRLPDFSPVEVVTRVVRDGRRIRLIEADFVSGGTAAARASCQLLRRGEAPPGRVWKPEPWDAPPPADVPLSEGPRRTAGGKWAIRPISGTMGEAGRKRAWMSEVRELVEGVALTPFVRVAVASDYASPFAHGGDTGLEYINTDVTLYLHRPLAGEWVGFENVNHGATAGVAVGECFLHDEQGPVGFAACAALANQLPHRR